MVDRQHTEKNNAMIQKNSFDQSVFHTCLNKRYKIIDQSLMFYIKWKEKSV